MLQDQLQKLPKGLNELFKDLLMRDKENIEELLLCVQWLLYAKRPLKLEEFYYAIVSGNHPLSLGAWDSEKVTLQDMERFVLDI